jgi:hypothetical protein
MAKKYLKLGATLKKLLFDRDMRPVDLARELDIPQPTIHRLVTGKSTRPYRSSLEPIAAYFSLTVDQLIGEEVLPDSSPKSKGNTEKIRAPGHQVKTIPILTWESAAGDRSWPKGGRGIVSAGNISDDCFALLMQDFSMSPLFPKSTILVFDPHKPAVDRSFVLVKLKDKAVPVFRQLLIDVDHKYLKPLNPDLSTYEMRLLSDEDEVIASLFESRMNHESDGANTFLLEDS